MLSSLFTLIKLWYGSVDQWFFLLEYLSQKWRRDIVNIDFPRWGSVSGWGWAGCVPAIAGSTPVCSTYKSPLRKRRGLLPFYKSVSFHIAEVEFYKAFAKTCWVRSFVRYYTRVRPDVEISSRLTSQRGGVSGWGCTGCKPVKAGSNPVRSSFKKEYVLLYWSGAFLIHC